MLVRAEIKPIVSIVDKNGDYRTMLWQDDQPRKCNAGKSFAIDINGRIVIPLKTGETIYVGFE